MKRVACTSLLVTEMAREWKSSNAVAHMEGGTSSIWCQLLFGMVEFMKKRCESLSHREV